MERYLLVAILATVFTTVCAKYLILPPKMLVFIVCVWAAIIADFISRLLLKKNLFQILNDL